MSQCGCIDVSDFINPTVATATPVYSNILMTIHYEGNTVSATPDHPFFVVEKNDFVPLEDIQSGMHLKGKDNYYSIDSITRANDAWVMDIAPNEELSYYVGEEPILTSMNNGCDFLLRQALLIARKDPENYTKLFEAANTNAELFHKLLEKLPQGQAGALFDELANWDADAINSFIAALNKADRTLSGAHISTKIDQLNKDILEKWYILYEAKTLPRKRFDFDFLNSKTIEEIKSIAKKGSSNLADAVGKSKIITKLDALGDLTHAKNFVNSLDAVADASLLSKVDNLTNDELLKLEKFYSNLSLPGNFKTLGKLNFEQVAVLGDFGTIKIKYKNGLPNFKEVSPNMNFVDGSSSKFKYSSESLNGGKLNSSDFKSANEALAKKMGVEKVNGKWPKLNSEGYLQNGNYRWKKTGPNFSLNFELKINGKWKKMTWHHFEDGKTMFPVPTDIHNNSLFRHSGGKSIIDYGDKVSLKGKLFVFEGF